MTITTTPWIPKKYLKALNAAVEMMETIVNKYSEEEYEKEFAKIFKKDKHSDPFFTLAVAMIVDANNKFGEDYVFNLIDTFLKEKDCK